MEPVVESSLELKEIFRIIRKRLWLIVLITFLASATSFYISTFKLVKQYQATTTLLVNQTVTNPQIMYNQLLADQQLVTTYSDIIKSHKILIPVIQKLALPLTPDQLAKDVQVDSVHQSQVISVTVTYPNPRAAVNIANEIANTFKSIVISLMSVQNVQIVDPAALPVHPTPVKPIPSLNTAIAFVVGLMMSTGLVFLLEHLDTSVRSERDLEIHFDLPVLGVIGTIETKKYERKSTRKARQSAPKVLQR
jgi:capsular polysaccharide biosynthesis protein